MSLKIAPALTQLLEKIRTEHGKLNEEVIINFRDPDYSAETGGFHPVEISLKRDGSLRYVTDFCYVGREPFVELAKELDWDFEGGTYEQLFYGANLPLQVGAEMFGIWQRNFLSYYDMKVFTVEVNSY